MSFGNKPQTSTTDPYKGMPDWVKDYYKSTIADSTARNAKASDLAAEFSDGKKLVADYQGQGDLDAVRDAAQRGETGINDAFGSATDRMRTAESGANATLGNIRSGMDSGRQALGGINTNLGRAFDTGGDQATIRGAGAAGAAGTRAASDSAIAGMRGINGDFGSAFDTSGNRDALTGMDIEGMQNRYQSNYVDAMVNPVMSRMQEDQARRMAQLEGSAAAIGGGSNTRMAVEMARTTDEGLRSRAQQEAEMRYQAERTGQEMGMQEAALRGDFQQMAAQLGLSESELDSQIKERMANFGMSREQAIGEMGMASEAQQAGLSMDSASLAAQLGMSESDLDAQIQERAARLGISVIEAQQGIMNDMAGVTGQEFGNTQALAQTEQQQGAAALSGAQMGMEAGMVGLNEAERQRLIETEQMQAPVTMAGWEAGIQSTGLPSPLPGGGTTTTTGGGPGLGTQILGAVTSLGGAAISASDERIKEDITPLGGALDTIRRQRPSSYAYTDAKYDRVPEQGRRSAGLMAQDLEDIPGAVIEIDGVKHVDSYPVMATIVAAMQELDRKMESMGHG